MGNFLMKNIEIEVFLHTRDKTGVFYSRNIHGVVV